jgi:hypothetical protein
LDDLSIAGLVWSQPRGAQLDNQLLITLPADCAAQPQSRKDRHRRGDPERSGLGLGIQLIGLNLAKIEVALADKLSMHLFGMLPSDV